MSSTSLTTAPCRNLSAIERCRTAALGGQIEQCDHCGQRRFCYRSCRNRHCPKRQGKRSPDLSGASGFRLYSMLVDAAVKGMGTAIGHPAVIAREMQRGALVPVFDRQVEAPARCCLITTADSRRNAGVQAFREGRRAGNRTGERAAPLAILDCSIGQKH